MPDDDARLFFVLTPRGDRGPIDRAELRNLLQQGAIASSDQVRNAFGRQLGRVSDVLGAGSDRIGSPIPNHPRPSLGPTILVALVAAAGIVLLIALSSGASPPPPQPESAEANPAPEPPAPALSPAPDPPPPPVLPAGLVGEFFKLKGDLRSFPDFDPLTPVGCRIETTINVSNLEAWPGTGLKEFFGARFTGVLRITSAEAYTFSLTSDDGSRLRIDHRIVVDNGGLHGMEERTGTVRLAVGDHPLELFYYQAGGPFGCSLAWWSDSNGRRWLDGRNLFHQPDPRVDAPH